MRTIERLNAVIEHIETNLTEKIDLADLAAITHSSLYDFQRMFGFIAEITVVEYIRKRRLSLAGQELQQGLDTVLNTALKYAYNSPVSFARAFQAFHGIAPSRVKGSDVQLKMFPRVIFQITVKEVPNVMKTEKMIVNGKEYTASFIGDEDLTTAENEWAKPYIKREFWRLEDAYDVFKDMRGTNDVLPYSDYPAPVEDGQVFAINISEKQMT